MKFIRTKGKGQRWKKGHSCVSNAPNTKHREAAKGRYFQKIEGMFPLSKFINFLELRYIDILY